MSSLRLKRVVSDLYKLSWWSPVAVDEGGVLSR